MTEKTNGPRVSYKDILAKKHNGQELTDEEITAIVDGAQEGKMEQAQIGSFLTSVFLNSLSLKEATILTLRMKESGETLQWPSEWSNLIVDKHSTGGVGDKVSLPLAPALAACGYKVPMISGRGLAHTGGTLDKLESIPDFTVSLTSDQMTKVLQDVGCFIAGQTGNICPADKIFYAHRDATSTVDENGLIASSILSKKAAENPHALILDVKIGDGAFKKTVEEGRYLAQTMVNCSEGLGIRTIALLTDMNTPIGDTSGNALEIAESLQCLKGRGPDDLTDLVVELGGHLLEAASLNTSLEEGRNMIRNSLNDGQALQKFQAMLEAQGVSNEHAQNLCDPNGDVWSVIQRAAHITEIVADKDGYIENIAAMPVAEVVQNLGGGRDKPGEAIDHTVGVELLLHVGDQIKKGQAWTKVHHSQAQLPSAIKQKIESALVVSESPVERRLTRVLNVVRPSTTSSK